MSPFELGPVIALLMQPLGNHSSYIPASYVKWLEMAGARVIPLSWYASAEETDAVYRQADGSLWSGGGAPVPFAARRLFASAMADYRSGKGAFPIWGTCDGFEWLMQVAAEDDKVLKSGFVSENISLPLNLTQAAGRSSLLADANMVFVQGVKPRLSVRSAMRTLPITLNNHQLGVTPDDFAHNAKLPSLFDVLATNHDLKGREFISMVEGKGGLPMWGTQFHPEKNIFEQGMACDGSPPVPCAGRPTGRPFEHIAHSAAAVQMSQYMANFFVAQARKVKAVHSFDDPADLQKRLMYNKRTSTSAAPAFVQIYEFETKFDDRL